ESQYPVHFSIA
ncbi:hypothetical protein D039_2486B, partial [Vibrio parahaemolyticus EKP-028]